MDWAGGIALGLFVAACALAIHRSRAEASAIDRKLGTVIFLGGAAIGSFLDDIRTAHSSILPWGEPIGAAGTVAGLFVAWFWQPGRAD